MMLGVVSIPDGWATTARGRGSESPSASPGVSVNDILDPEHIDELSSQCAQRAGRDGRKKASRDS